MTDSPSTLRVLSIDPTSGGFGFALLEGPRSLIDWGTKRASQNKNRRCLQLVAELADRYAPDVLVIEDFEKQASRRCSRVKKLLHRLEIVARAKNLRIKRISVRAIKNAFAPVTAVTKDQIAREIARVFPELDLRLPPIRKPWMSEDDRLSIFDAAAQALTFFAIKSKCKSPAKSTTTDRSYA